MNPLVLPVFGGPRLNEGDFGCNKLQWTLRLPALLECGQQNLLGNTFCFYVLKNGSDTALSCQLPVRSQDKQTELDVPNLQVSGKRAENLYHYEK